MAHQTTIDEIQNALRAHGMWKLRLKTAVNTCKSDVDPENAACDNLCEFGKWLHGDTIPADLQGTLPHQVIIRLHAEFHQLAGSVLKESLAGNSEQAKALLDGAFADKSETLARALGKWKNELRAS